MSERGDEAEIARLRAAITRLNNRICVSRDLRYLRNRLADLQSRKGKGEDVRHASSQESATILTCSMPEAARLAAVEIGNRLKIGTSAAVRLALGDLARRRGWKTLANAFEE